MAKKTKDFFGREERHAFTFFDKRKKLYDWESDVAEGEGLSTFFLKGKDPGKAAPKLLGSMLNVVGVKNSASKLSVSKVHNKLQIPLDMVKNADGTFVTDHHQLDKFFGASVQRASLFKNLSAEEYARMIGANYKAPSSRRRNTSGTSKTDKIFDVLKSCIYQEMGDKHIADNCPGYLKFIQKYKKELFEEKWEIPSFTASKKARFLDLLVRMLRYPGAVSEEELDDFSKEMGEVEKSLKPFKSFPNTQNQADKMVRQLYKIVHSIEEEPEPPSGGQGDGDSDENDGEENQQQSGKGNGKSSGSSNGSKEKEQEQEEEESGDQEEQQEQDSQNDDSEQEGESDQGKNDKSEEKEEKEPEEKEEENDSEGNSDDSEKDEEESEEEEQKNQSPEAGDSEEDEEEDEEEESDQTEESDDDFDDDEDEQSDDDSEEPEDDQEEIDNQLFDQLKDLLNIEMDNEHTNETDLSDFTEEMKTPPKVLPKIDYSELGKIIEGNVEFVKASTDSSRYELAKRDLNLKKSHVLRNLFAMKNEDHKFSLKSMKSGKFDENKLVEARAGVQTVYERMGSVTVNKLCIVVLVDESGSMSGRVRHSKYSKMELARQAAIYLNEIFGVGDDVELYVYGHKERGYSHSTISIYREPGLQVDRNALGSMDSGGCNRDGEAIIGVAKRVRRMSDRKGIFIVISDGQPNGHQYDGKVAIEHTRLMVKQTERLGFEVVQIAIESGVPSHEMFSHWVNMTDVNNLPNDLARYMTRKVDKMMVQNVTF